MQLLHYEDIGDHPERISKLKKYVDKYDWSGLEFPVAIKNINKFEKNNPTISVNVLGIDKGEIGIIRPSKYYNREKKFDYFYTMVIIQLLKV